MFEFNIHTIEYGFLAYACLIFGSYILQGFISFYSLKSFTAKKKFIDEGRLLDSDILPTVALIAPAYNESAVIVQSVRSLLTAHYFDLELVIVNDGSSDDTMQKLIDNFSLIPSETRPYNNLSTKKVINTYRSKNSAFKNLLVIDKENGRKADAINVGINHSWADYYAVIDLDCILEPNALLMMVEPVLQSQDKKVVAVGGVIGAANDCTIKHGKFIEAKVPKKILPRIQIIEYIRSFILGRTAWNQVNGLLLISGALGMFERETLIAVGGYSHDAIGEDMDLVMKMHKHCLENKIDYKIGYIPYPLCWTEVPESKTILSSQRNRWMRGTIECMYKFRGMFLNPKYGIIGMVSYPFWLFTEMLAPVIEFLGMGLIVYFIVTGQLNLGLALILLFFIYFLTLSHSFIAIMIYYLNFDKYNSRSDLIKLFKTATVEAIYYHPKVLYWGLRGYYDYFFSKNLGWGKMTRKGFSTSP